MATIIKDIDTLKAAIGGIQQTMQWKSWVSFVKQAEMLFIKPAIGEDLYDELTALAYGTASEKQKGLLDWLYISIGEYTDFLGGIRLIMQTSDAGKQVPSMNNMQAPSKWMYVTNRKESQLKADTALESALAYLEKNKAYFPAWAASDEYSLSYDLFISSATELTQYFPAAKKSRRLFLQMREYIRTAEVFWAPGVVGEELWEAWKTKLETKAALTDQETNAWQLLRYAEAHYAISESVSFLNITEDWRLLSETDGTVNEEVLDTARRAELKAECLKKCEEYQNRLLRYLQKNASEIVFPEFFSSALYKPELPATASLYPNKSENKYFVL